jgi:hypothetical protein
MHADFSVELCQEDPMLELPWTSDDPSVRYYDLKSRPELVLQIPEAAAHPEISAFLARINAADSPLETAKCDAWPSREISAEEEIFGASQKFVSYIDLVFVDENVRGSFEKHEKFASELCQLLNRAPDMAATVELIIRRCYYHQREMSSGASNKYRRDQCLRNQQLDKDLRSNVAGRETSAGAQERSGSDLDDVAQEPSESDSNGVARGLYFTAYVSGFGDSGEESQHRWAIAMALLRHALVQLSLTSPFGRAGKNL